MICTLYTYKTKPFQSDHSHFTIEIWKKKESAGIIGWARFSHSICDSVGAISELEAPNKLGKTAGRNGEIVPNKKMRIFTWYLIVISYDSPHSNIVEPDDQQNTIDSTLFTGENNKPLKKKRITKRRIMYNEKRGRKIAAKT